jgi:hypothetical protein
VSSPSKAFGEAAERHEHARGGDRLVPLVSAIVAVLAAFGSLFAHHKSIQALAIKNEAIHDTIEASDRYAYYQTQRVRVSVYNALLDAGLARDEQAHASLQKSVLREETASLGVLADAKALETRAAWLQDRGQQELNASAQFEVATTLFEIAIVLASISALAGARGLLWGAIGASSVGIILAALAFIQGAH